MAVGSGRGPNDLAGPASTYEGAGFDPSAALGGAAGAGQARFGLRGMRDRAEMLGGTFQAVSRPGEGAVLRMYLPRWRPDPGEGA